MLTKNCFSLLFAALMAVTALSANDRSPIAERTLSHAQYRAIEEARTKAEERVALQYGYTTEESYYNYGADHKTSHKGSYHIYSGVTAYADQVELEDGSMWFVLPAEREKILDWVVGDTIAILKGDKNSNYKYRLCNERTFQIVEVELSASPYLDSFYRLTIKDINKEKRFLLLSDGSKWILPTNWFEQEVWMKWYIGDTIIIGTNDQFFGSWSKPDILINFTCSATYTPSKCVN
jgi:hypothetical protein